MAFFILTNALDGGLFSPQLSILGRLFACHIYVFPYGDYQCYRYSQ